jgi:hypothetical protein
MRQLAMLERMCASPGMARATIESNLRIDVRPILRELRISLAARHTAFAISGNKVRRTTAATTRMT